MIDNIQICKRCVMDTTDLQIGFDESGICNHCKEYDDLVILDKSTLSKKETQFTKILTDIKFSGKDKEYDCIIGISGGVYSTYLAYLVKEKYGLNPLAVHLDNGWNSKLAVKNIKNILRKLDIDLHTHVIEWEEFKNMQTALRFPQASPWAPSGHPSPLLWAPRLPPRNFGSSSSSLGSPKPTSR